jgi:hypothetical protein
MTRNARFPYIGWLTLAAAVLLFSGCNCTPGSCSGDGNCEGTARFCVAGECAECRTDGDCGDPAAPRCNAGACGCLSDADCTTGCGADGRCAPCDGTTCGTSCDGSGGCLPCSATVPCREGLLCTAGACLNCAADTECAPGEACRNGLCGSTCVSAADCDTSASASLAGGAPMVGSLFGCRLYGIADTCIGGSFYPKEGFACAACAGDGDCAAGQACRGGDCTCAANADCAAGDVCSGGFCGMCWTDDDCDCDTYCENGRCRPICATDADCPGGRCNPATLRCARCIEDTDCATGEVCFEDGCLEPCDVDPDRCFFECTANGRCLGCEQYGPGPAAAPVPPGC